jgi:DnaJ-class molecular chaperone
MNQAQREFERMMVSLMMDLFGPQEPPKGPPRIVCEPHERVPHGEHKHQCPKCKTTWKHEDAYRNAESEEVFQEAHTCPHCDTAGVYEKHDLMSNVH